MLMMRPMIVGKSVEPEAIPAAFPTALSPLVTGDCAWTKAVGGAAKTSNINTKTAVDKIRRTEVRLTFTAVFDEPLSSMGKKDLRLIGD